MGFKMGIVGLPNVGKSTLFNALTKTAAAQAANFPFCTIEPNVGEVAVPDARLDRLAEIGKSKQIIPTRMTFVDIAGLVKGASKGEGLGNQFLANIREVDAIAHVLRCFEDGDVTHVEGRVDPVADAETIETELMLADIESIEKRLQNILRKVRGGEEPATMEGPADVWLDGEVSRELGPGDLLVRSSKIFHATWKNETETGRLMHHWLFRDGVSDNHRFRFDDYLTDELVSELTEQQRQVLWLQRNFELDPIYAAERERELGKVRWSTVL